VSLDLALDRALDSNLDLDVDLDRIRALDSGLARDVDRARGLAPVAGDGAPQPPPAESREVGIIGTCLPRIGYGPP
jgi:hypothetical protein